ARPRREPRAPPRRHPGRSTTRREGSPRRCARPLALTPAQPARPRLASRRSPATCVTSWRAGSWTARIQAPPVPCLCVEHAMKSKAVIGLGVAVAGAGRRWFATQTRARPAAKEEKEAKSASLPIGQVVLYSSGVGYFQREGSVEGNARVDLSF